MIPLPRAPGTKCKYPSKRYQKPISQKLRKRKSSQKADYAKAPEMQKSFDKSTSGISNDAVQRSFA
jgi:hypothetical protein